MKESSTTHKSTLAPQYTDLTPYYDELMQDVPYSAWAEYIHLLMHIADVAPKTVLDCACGTGNVSFELAKLGFDVTGVDLSAGMIARAQEKLEKQNPTPSVRFLQADLSNFDLKQKFDAATCLYDSFNYIIDPQKLEAAFAHIGKHIVPGGVFIFDMNTPWAFEADLFTQNNLGSRKTLRYNWHADYNPETRICDVTMYFERHTPNGVEKFSEVHRERAYSLTEINGMLSRTGWKLFQIYDAYSLNGPHKHSERWFFLVQKL